MSQTSYLLSCEVLCGEGSDGALEGKDRAFLIVAVNAASEDDAIAKVEADFDEEGYAIVEIEWIATAADMQWEDADGEAEAKDILVRLAELPEEVIYGMLYDISDDDMSEAARTPERRNFSVLQMTCGRLNSGRIFLFQGEGVPKARGRSGISSARRPGLSRAARRCTSAGVRWWAGASSANRRRLRNQRHRSPSRFAGLPPGNAHRGMRRR